MINPDLNGIFLILDKLGIPYNKKLYKQKWIPVLCSSHPDTSLGNAYMDSETTITKCFACGASYNLYTLVKMLNPELDRDSILEFMGYSEDHVEYSVLNGRKNKVHAEEIKGHSFYHRVITKSRSFSASAFAYTRERGFTDDFIKRHNIKYVYEGFYKGYIQIPIDVNGIIIPEFRKVQDNTRLKNKVLYPKNAPIRDTIWNFKDLSKYEDLWISEGIPGTARVQTTVTKNSTSIFGSNISNQQLDLLKIFNKVIIVPDIKIEKDGTRRIDDASLSVIVKIYESRNKETLVFGTKFDDKEEEFSNDLKKRKGLIKPAFQVIKEAYGLNEWVIQ